MWLSEGVATTTGAARVAVTVKVSAALVASPSLTVKANSVIPTAEGLHVKTLPTRHEA